MIPQADRSTWGKAERAFIGQETDAARKCEQPTGKKRASENAAIGDGPKIEPRHFDSNATQAPLKARYVPIVRSPQHRLTLVKGTASLVFATKGTELPIKSTCNATGSWYS